MEYETQPMSTDRVLAEMASMEANLHATGAVDVEAAQLAALRRDLLSGKVNAEQAMDKLHRMMESRQDYH